MWSGISQQVKPEEWARRSRFNWTANNTSLSPAARGRARVGGAVAHPRRRRSFHDSMFTCSMATRRIHRGCDEKRNELQVLKATALFHSRIIGAHHDAVHDRHFAYVFTDGS